MKSATIIGIIAIVVCFNPEYESQEISNQYSGIYSNTTFIISKYDDNLNTNHAGKDASKDDSVYADSDINTKYNGYRPSIDERDFLITHTLKVVNMSHKITGDSDAKFNNIEYGSNLTQVNETNLVTNHSEQNTSTAPHIVNLEFNDNENYGYPTRLNNTDEVTHPGEKINTQRDIRKHAFNSADITNVDSMLPDNKKIKKVDNTESYVNEYGSKKTDTEFNFTRSRYRREEILPTCAVVKNELFSFVAKKKCPGSVCWQSQLVQKSKMNITKMYNEFREKVAKGKCKDCTQEIANMAYMVWNWELEGAAIQIASANCPQEILSYTGDDTFMSISYPGKEKDRNYQITCEMSAGFFKQKHATQTDMLRLLPGILQDNKLTDFERGTTNFRRATMTQFACSYIARKGVFDEEHPNKGDSGARGHLICVYCRNKSNPETIYADGTDTSKCPTGTVKAQSEYLCSPVRLKSVYPCEIYPSCTETEPDIWKVAKANAPHLGKTIKQLEDEIASQEKANLFIIFILVVFGLMFLILIGLGGFFLYKYKKGK